MATPPSQHLTRINAPLNFRHTDTLITTKVPHYPTKLTTGMSIIPGWNRPNANGQNANINDKDYNGPDFKPRPLKHWRRQLRVYDYKGGANNSRAASISQLDRPGLTVYHFKPDCTCVPGEGGNSYIISNNKFGYETKDDDYSKGVLDVKIQNNGFTTVPYDATEAQINDPTNPAYKVLTGVYNTDCINCSPQGNLIKSGIAFQSQAFYSYSNDKLETRCQTYEQNLSTNKAPGCIYFDAQGIPLWPNNEPNGPQVVAPVNYGSTTYKGNFFNLYDYPIILNAGGVGSALQVLSAPFIPKIKCRPVYVKAGFYVYIDLLTRKYYATNHVTHVTFSSYYSEPASIIAVLYDNNNNIITSSNIQPAHISATPYPIPPSYYESIITFYFPENVYINPSTTYYINFESVNNVPFDWFVVDYGSTPPNSTLAGTLVAEALYCPSQTIYKPNNIGFGRQGAVSGSTRLKKLVSDTVTLNGSSFYSAKGAQEANLGKYQGTNVSGNYYVKIKEVTNSCIGTVPGKPILSVIDVDTSSITFSWEDTGSTLCKVLHYSLTYYAIQILGTVRSLSYDNNNNNNNNIYNNNIYNNNIYNNNIYNNNIYNNNIYNNIYNNEQFITSSRDISLVNNIPTPIYDDAIYTDLNNNIKYKIISKITTDTVLPDILDTQLTYKLTGLAKSTAYIAYITGYNGNGLGESSDKIVTETLLDPNLAVNIQSPYSYEYNNLPQILYGTATSDTQTINSNNIIRTSIAYDTKAIYKNVASIYSNNNIQNTFKILLQNAGYFNVYAFQARFGEYGSSSVLFGPIVVSKSTPTIKFEGNFTKPLTYGMTYHLPSAIIENTNKNKNDGKNILFKYQPHNNSIASIQTTVNGNSISHSVYIIGVAPFYIVISTILNAQLSQNYNEATPIHTDTFTVLKSTPSILQSPNFIASGTYGSPYTFYPPSINYNPVIQPPGSVPQTLIYSIKNSSPAEITSIDESGKVTINGAGTFKIYSYCNSTSVYNPNFLLSPTITIDKEKPIITFPKSFVTAATYDVPYKLVPAIINNKVQKLSYNVIDSVPANNVVNISTIYNNTNTDGGSKSGTIQYSPSQSNNLQKISYGIINPTHEGFLNSISFQQLNANTLTNYYIVSVQSDTHNVNINSTYSTYSNPDGMSLYNAYPNPSYPAFPIFSQAILSTIVDDVYISNISIALSYPGPGVTSYFACDLVATDTITGNPVKVNLTNNPLSSIQLPIGVSGGALYMYNFSCNVILTEPQLANATLVIKSGSNAAYYPSTNGNMYIEINYISILTSKCSIVSIPANVITCKDLDVTDFAIVNHPVHSHSISFILTSKCSNLIIPSNIETSQNFDVTDFAVLMHPAHSYTISLWLLGNITKNVSGYEIYSGNGTICATNGSTPYIYGTIKQGVPITNISEITKHLYFNGLGTFNINASCNSTSNYYANSKISNKVVIAGEFPSITFSQNLNLTCVYNVEFVLPIPLATVNNNIQNISYSLVSADDDESKTTVATINQEGTQLLINSVGNFRIKASVIETTNLDFSKAQGLSKIITITKATPSITFNSTTFQTTVPYLKNYKYQIVGVSTTNTDIPAPILSYSSSDTTVATISDNTFTTIKTGNFYIYVSCPPTNNFNGVTSFKSPPITIKKATPIFTIPPDFAKNWTFTSSTPYSLTGITSSNTDSNSSIQYTILSQKNTVGKSSINIAQLITPTPPLMQVTQIQIYNAGSFILQIQSPETQNFIPWSVDPPILIIIPQITPTITLKKLPPSWVYGSNPYTFTPATITNSYPSQIITYSITTISCPNPPIGSFANNTIPSITINSVGTFQINATCLPSTNGNYTAPSVQCISNLISVGKEKPTITFSSSLVNIITYAYNLNYPLPYPIAYVNNNVQTQSLFKYSIVNMDNDDPSTVASVSSNNVSQKASLTINSVGSFRIYAQVGNSINHDFGANEAYYSINITPATPTITSSLAIPLSWIYGGPYIIPYPTTSNKDATSSAQIVSYSTDSPDIISISGTSINITGVGQFQIYVNIASTNNYKAATYTYPSGLLYIPGNNYTNYTASPATTVVEFSVKQIATYDTPYILTPAVIKVPNPSSQTITYSIQ